MLATWGEFPVIVFGMETSHTDHTAHNANRKLFRTLLRTEAADSKTRSSKCETFRHSTRFPSIGDAARNPFGECTKSKETKPVSSGQFRKPPNAMCATVHLKHRRMWSWKEIKTDCACRCAGRQVWSRKCSSRNECQQTLTANSDARRTKTTRHNVHRWKGLQHRSIEREGNAPPVKNQPTTSVRTGTLSPDHGFEQCVM